MPYIKSIRSTYEKSGFDVLKRFDISGGDRVWTAGGYKFHEFITAGQHEFAVRDRFDNSNNTLGLQVPATSITADVFAWGAGGGGAAPQGWAYGAPGGGGGFAGGITSIAGSTTLAVMVGGGGGASGNQKTPSGGGGNGTSWGNGTGGGLSGIFNSNSYTFANVGGLGVLHVLVPVLTVVGVVEQMHKTDFHHIKAQAVAAVLKMRVVLDLTAKEMQAASYKADQLAHTVVVVVVATMAVVVAVILNQTE